MVMDDYPRKLSEFENRFATEGAVSHVLDLFVDSPLRICAQILLRIENSLLSAIPREERIYKYGDAWTWAWGWRGK